MSAPSVRRKTAKSEGDPGPRCYCGELANDCGCDVFQPRPCLCGHPYHRETCDACECQKYRPDRTPEFLLRQGIRAGEWGILPLDRIADLMQPKHEPIARVWACVITHVTDRRGRGRSNARLAMVLLENGKTLAPLTPSVIVAKLNALDQVPRMDKHMVRKHLRELERRGNIRVVGSQKGKVRIFAYAKPLAGRDLPDIPDEPGEFGGLIRPPKSSNTLDPNYLRENVFLPVRAMLVKTFRRVLRDELESRNLKGVKLDPQILIDQVVEELLLGVQSAHQKLIQGVCELQKAPEKANESAVSPPSTSLVVPLLRPEKQSVSQSEPTDRPTHAEIRAAIPKELCDSLQEQPTPVLLNRISQLMAGVPIARLTLRIRTRRKAITSLGLLERLAGDVARKWAEESAVLEAAQPAPLPAACTDCEGTGFIGGESWDTLQSARVLMDLGVPFCECRTGNELREALQDTGQMAGVNPGGGR